MFETFILDADNGQILCTTKDKKVLTIKVDDFATYIPFQAAGANPFCTAGSIQG
jgi:hypothetical protein